MIICPTCDATGDCQTCDGSGVDPNDYDNDCQTCGGNGICTTCDGACEVEEE